jgi:hypothetical protein
MAESGRRYGVPPRGLSLQGARQTIEEFSGTLGRAAGEAAEGLAEAALWAIAFHRAGERPNRVELGWSSGGRRRTRECTCPGGWTEAACCE